MTTDLDSLTHSLTLTHSHYTHRPLYSLTHSHSLSHSPTLGDTHPLTLTALTRSPAHGLTHSSLTHPLLSHTHASMGWDHSFTLVFPLRTFLWTSSTRVCSSDTPSSGELGLSDTLLFCSSSIAAMASLWCALRSSCSCIYTLRLSSTSSV